MNIDKRKNDELRYRCGEASSGELVYDEQNPLSFVQALGALGITGAINGLSGAYKFDMKTAPAEFVQMYQDSHKRAGIYTQRQEDAKMLATFFWDALLFRKYMVVVIMDITTILRICSIYGMVPLFSIDGVNRK